MPLQRSSREFASLARELRQRSTSAERALWELLRDRRFLGAKFRRQVPVTSFIADFLCERLRLIVEVDGGVHQLPEQEIRDENRELTLRELGYTVVRFTNEEVLNEPEEVLQRLRARMQR